MVSTVHPDPVAATQLVFGAVVQSELAVQAAPAALWEYRLGEHFLGHTLVRLQAPTLTLWQGQSWAVEAVATG